MKKLIALILALILCLSTCMLASCQDGRDGKDGTNGKDGSNGKSAYDIAVEYGFKGTEEEWLASLKTEKDPNADSIGLDFTLSEDETYYILSGVGYNDDIVINIPAEYNGLPVKEIGNSAFKNYNWVRKINIPDGVTTIGENAFYNCTMLKEINIPQTVTSIGYAAFSGCTGLTSVHISSIEAWCNIKFANDYANPLNYAHNLYLNGNLVTDLIIPDSVTSIGNYAFENCHGLTSVTIGNSVTSIGDYAFFFCPGLTTINYSGTMAEWRAIKKPFQYIPKGVSVICTDGTITT